MKLATLDNGTRDGRLVLVSRDHHRAVPADKIAATMQDALERWTEVEAPLLALARSLESDDAPGAFAFVANDMLAPLPRAWQWLDGSAYDSHGELMRLATGRPAPPSDAPLMYQG
ncbi:MAG: fumarylacetoacetate hydrolase, partial [Sphingomicrobium sp.]